MVLPTFTLTLPSLAFRFPSHRVRCKSLLQTLSELGLPTLSAGGDEGNRTLDPLLAGQVLSQLSYTPILLGCFFSVIRSLTTEQQKIQNSLLASVPI